MYGTLLVCGNVIVWVWPGPVNVWIVPVAIGVKVRPSVEPDRV